jgi:hypothetical protein
MQHYRLELSPHLPCISGCLGSLIHPGKTEHPPCELRAAENSHITHCVTGLPSFYCKSDWSVPSATTLRTEEDSAGSDPP